jgi:hypothetical protein
VWIAACLAGLGCATADTAPVGPSAKRAIVAPVNFDVATPAQLEAGLEETDRLVQMFLRHRGFETERVPLGRFRELWREASDGAVIAVDAPAFGSVAGKVLAQLAPGDADSILVVPGILYRTGELKGARAKWDGVDWKGYFNEPTRAVSIWVRIFASPDRMIHEGYGGTELPWKIVGDTSGGLDVLLYKYRIENRTDLFQDAGKVARGIKLAFHPYIPNQ